MKPLACLLSVLFAACARAAPSIEAPNVSVRCELVGVETSAEEESATATFLMTNATASALPYQGHSADGPIYSMEVESAPGVWEASLLGWCGTGLAEYALEPGKTLRFRVPVPTDGRNYRFRIGDWPVMTPPVSALPR